MLKIGDIAERRLSKVENRTSINVVLLGECGVGKSSFVIKYVEGRFETYYVTTIGKEISTKRIKYNDTFYTINFTVTSGHPEFKEDYTATYEHVDFFLMFYDVTNRKTFDNLKSYVQDLRNYFFKYKNKSINVIFIGNKCDEKNRQVTNEEALTFCKKNDLDLVEISVKTNMNVAKVVNKILETFDDMAAANKEDE